MRNVRVLAAVGSLALLALPACAGEELPQGNEAVDLDPAKFTTEIDNRYWPMAPGTRWTYREVDEQGKEARVVVTATSTTKRIANGVTARVVRDTVTEHGEVIEDTFDWYAQDEDGNVWYLGEDTAELEDGAITTKEGSFEAGKDGALPGIIMPADPKDGMRYRQEYYKGHAEDNGEILSVDERVDVPAGSFGDAILTKDTNSLEPDVVEYKLYAARVGPVLTFGVSGEGGSETLLEQETVAAETARAAGTTQLGRPYP
ncbi:MAG TPA: hypothetical protein VFO03_00830 [Gaiellaceae bacterium]|nr:hypothetical protein [Gaiellaceae bacterium]